MNATQAQINVNRTNAKRLRAAGFHDEADAYDATADEMRDELNELERRRIAAKHAAVNPDEPVYDAASHQRTIAARYADPHQHEPNQVCLADMMLITGRVDHAQWIGLIWPTLPEIEY